MAQKLEPRMSRKRKAQQIEKELDPGAEAEEERYALVNSNHSRSPVKSVPVTNVIHWRILIQYLTKHYYESVVSTLGHTMSLC